MIAVSISSLRTKMKEYFDAVINSSETLIIPRNGKDDEAIVILSIKEYNSLMETNYLNGTVKNFERLEQSKKEHQTGNVVSFQLPE